MIPFIIAGAIGYGIAKLLEKDTKKFVDGGEIGEMSDSEVEAEFENLIKMEIVASDIDEDNYEEALNLSISEKRAYLIKNEREYAEGGEAGEYSEEEDEEVVFDYKHFNSKITKIIGGNAYFGNSQVTDLGKLTTIVGGADFENSKVTDLGQLTTIGGFTDFENSQITDLGKLTTIGGGANFKNSQVTDLGQLTTIGGDAYFWHSQVTDLGQLTTIGGDAYFENSQVTDLGQLTTIVGGADFRNSQITDLGQLTTIGRYADFENSKVTDLGQLTTIVGNAYFRDSQITDLGQLTTIGGDAFFGDRIDLENEWKKIQNKTKNKTKNINSQTTENFAKGGEAGVSEQAQLVELIQDFSSDEYKEFCYEHDIDEEDAEEMSNFIYSQTNNRCKEIIQEIEDGYYAGGYDDMEVDKYAEGGSIDKIFYTLGFSDIPTMYGVYQEWIDKKLKSMDVPVSNKTRLKLTNALHDRFVSDWENGVLGFSPDKKRAVFLEWDEDAQVGLEEQDADGNWVAKKGSKYIPFTNKEWQNYFESISDDEEYEFISDQIEEKEVETDIINKIKYYPKGIPPMNHLYGVRYKGKTYTSNDTDDLVQKVLLETNKFADGGETDANNIGEDLENYSNYDEFYNTVFDYIKREENLTEEETKDICIVNESIIEAEFEGGSSPRFTGDVVLGYLSNERGYMKNGGGVGMNDRYDGKQD